MVSQWQSSHLLRGNQLLWIMDVHSSSMIAEWVFKRTSGKQLEGQVVCDEVFSDMLMRKPHQHVCVASCLSSAMFLCTLYSQVFISFTAGSSNSAVIQYRGRVILLPGNLMPQLFQHPYFLPQPDATVREKMSRTWEVGVWEEDRCGLWKREEVTDKRTNRRHRWQKGS